MKAKQTRRGQNTEDARERERLRRETLAELLELLTNVSGIRRLRAISDDEWQKAVDEEGGSAA